MPIDPLIKKHAVALREESGYGASEALHLHSFLFKNNIITYFQPLSENFSGMAFHYNTTDFILVNSNQAIGRQNFTIAHELYHLRVQQDFETHQCNVSNLKVNPKAEKDANLFASLFLLPEDALLENIPEAELRKDAISIGTLLRLEQIFEISHQFLLIRLKSLNLLTKKGIDYHSSYSVRQMVSDYGFPAGLYQPGNHHKVIGDYGLLAKTLLDKDRISEGHYRELMNCLKP